MIGNDHVRFGGGAAPEKGQQWLVPRRAAYPAPGPFGYYYPDQPGPGWL